MQRTMSLKGLVLILAAALIIFFILHSVLSSSVNENREKEQQLRVRLTKLEQEHKDLTTQISVVGTDDYIRSSAVRDYSYVRRDSIRFEYTNPEALYGYTDEEMDILMDEISEGGDR